MEKVFHREADDHTTGMMHRSVSKDGKYEIGLYVVMYGFRVRAGVVGEGWVELDYCVGMSMFHITAVYNSVMSIMADRIKKGEDPLRPFPRQNTKPMNNDPDCLFEIIELASKCEVMETVEFPTEELMGYREKTFDQHFNHDKDSSTT